MNPNTGAIACFETRFDAEEAGFTDFIPEPELPRVQSMSRHERRKWAAEQRRKRSRGQNRKKNRKGRK